MCTFASTKEPEANDFLKAEEITQISCFDNQSVFPSKRDRVYIKDPDDSDEDDTYGANQNKILFELAMKQYNLFFKKSFKKNPISMSNTR